MVVDTSALVAVIAEADSADYLAAIEEAERIAVSAVAMYETRVVLTGLVNGRPRYPIGTLEGILAVLARFDTEVVPFDLDQVVLAHRAYQRYGRGFHPAGLNLVDCASYALAQLRGEPLLFKGNDFARTDITPAL